MVQIDAFAVEQSRTLRIREQPSLEKCCLVVTIEKPNFTRKAESKPVQRFCDQRRATLLDEDVTEPRRHRDRRHACEPCCDRTVDVFLDLVMKDDVLLNPA